MVEYSEIDPSSTVVIRIRGHNPIGAENHAVVEFSTIDPTVGFWLPGLWGYELEASNPMGAENHVMVELPAIRLTTNFWLSGRRRDEFEARNPIKTENDVFDEFPEINATVVFCCPGGGDTYSKPATPSERKCRSCRISEYGRSRRFLATQDAVIRIRSQ